ncbi:dihydrofolate reductase family protein [Chitinophaga lutea]
MARLSAFIFLTINGFYKGPHEDISWHPHDSEGDELAVNSMQDGHILLFGRRTYELMASFWPTQAAAAEFPLVAAGMNASDKYVCSNTLQKAGWDKTNILRGDAVEAVRNLKATADRDITILGSGELTTALLAAGLMDNLSLMIDPVAIGAGTTLFGGMGVPAHLLLTSTRVFSNGAILLNYTPE